MFQQTSLKINNVCVFTKTSLKLDSAKHFGKLKSSFYSKLQLRTNGFFSLLILAHLNTANQ